MKAEVFIMANTGNGKEAVLALERILSKQPQTMRVLIQRLYDEYGITRERKAIYQDLAILTVFLPIEYVAKKGYFLREMEK